MTARRWILLLGLACVGAGAQPSPVTFDDELNVTATIDKVVEKQSKRGPIWFADISFEYRKKQGDELALREITRLVKQS